MEVFLGLDGELISLGVPTPWEPFLRFERGVLVVFLGDGGYASSFELFCLVNDLALETPDFFCSGSWVSLGLYLSSIVFGA